MTAVANKYPPCPAADDGAPPPSLAPGPADKQPVAEAAPHSTGPVPCAGTVMPTSLPTTPMTREDAPADEAAADEAAADPVAADDPLRPVLELGGARITYVGKGAGRSCGRGRLRSTGAG